MVWQKSVAEGKMRAVGQGVWTTDSGERVAVALKRFSSEQVRLARNDFLQEMSVAHSLAHENIVRLFGVMVKDDDVTLVS